MLTLGATAALAQQTSDQALIDLLIQKGVLTTTEAQQIQAEAAKTAKDSSTTTVSGKMYIDFSDITAKNAAGTKIDPSGDGLDVKRFYFGVTHQFDSVWSANINTDSGYSSATGNTQVFIKTAYVQAKLSPLAIIQAGSANQPWIPFVEDLYGFRYVENTLTDRLHVANSADWGLHLLGSNGMIAYNVAAVNGGGYKNPTRGKAVDLEGRVSLTPIKGLTFAVGGYQGKLGKDSNAATTTRNASREDGLIEYSTAQFTLGAEAFQQYEWGFTTGTATDKGDGYAVWGNVKIGGPFALFGRYDQDKPSENLHPAEKDQYYNLGVQYDVIKGVQIALVYKNDKVDNPASASQAATYDELGLFSQVAF